MPIDYCIDHSRRLVIARGRGVDQAYRVLPGGERAKGNRECAARLHGHVDRCDELAVDEDLDWLLLSGAVLAAHLRSPGRYPRRLA